MNSSEQDLDNLVLHCEKALFALYNDKFQSTREMAHKWLLVTQKSHDAWRLCWRLMHNDKPPEVQFFGASMLHFKISKNWSELLPEHFDTLRSEIFKHILAYSRGPKIVLTRLCVTLGALALQTMPEHWNNAINEIITTLQNVADTQDNSLYSVLFEVLTVLPEEFMTAHLIATRKMELRGELQSAVNQVLQVTQKGLSSLSPVHNKLQALRCLSSWVQFGLSISDVDGHLPCVFEAVGNRELFDSAVDLLIDVVTHPTSHKYPSCLWKFVSSFVQLHPTLRHALGTGDMDLATGLCRVIVSFAETHTRLLITPDSTERHQNAMQVIQTVLECTNAPGWYPVDEECSEMTFNVWYTLQDDICSQEPALLMHLRTVYCPVFASLCQVFLRKVQYPPDSAWNGYSSDEKEQFRYYRQDVADTMMYMYCVMRGHMLHQLHGTLSALLSNDVSTWQAVEATLYLIQSISENVEPEEETFLPAIFTLLPRLPSHPKVCQTALLMVGSYSEWLKCHPDQLRTVLPVLLSGLSQQNLASASTQALRGICEECVQDLSADVLQTILSHCQAALAGTVIKDRERVRCMECVGYVLSVNPPSTIMEKLQTAVGPYIHLLAQVLLQPPIQELKPKLQFYLKMFAVLFKCLDPEDISPNEMHPAAAVLKEVMPSLKALRTWIGNTEVTQDLCLCLERAIDTIRDHMGPLVAEIAELLVDFFTIVANSSLLDTGTMFVGMYGCEVQHYDTVAITFQKMATFSLQLLQTSIQEHPDILQSLMQFVIRALKSNARMVFDCDGMASHVIQCGLGAIALPESHTVRAASHFFVTFISTYETQEITRHTMEAYAQPLVGQVIKGIGGGAPRQCTDYLAEILVTLNKQCIALLSKCLQNVLAVEGFPSSLVTSQQKQQLSSSVLRGHANKKRVKQAVKEFSLLCRGLDGTEYAYS